MCYFEYMQRKPFIILKTVLCIIIFNIPVPSDAPIRNYQFESQNKSFIFERSKTDYFLWSVIHRKTNKIRYSIIDNTAKESEKQKFFDYTEIFLSNDGNRILVFNYWPEVSHISQNDEVAFQYFERGVEKFTIRINEIFNKSFGSFSVSHMQWVLNNSIDIDRNIFKFKTSQLKSFEFNFRTYKLSMTKNELENGKLQLFVGSLSKEKDGSYVFLGCDLNFPDQKVSINSLKSYVLNFQDYTDHIALIIYEDLIVKSSSFFYNACTYEQESQ